jgi:hypothetical protein
MAPEELIDCYEALVHSLTADRAVNVGRVSEQKHTSLAESRRHAVMYMIGREPIHLEDCEPGDSLSLFF